MFCQHHCADPSFQGLLPFPPPSRPSFLPSFYQSFLKYWLNQAESVPWIHTAMSNNISLNQKSMRAGAKSSLFATIPRDQYSAWPMKGLSQYLFMGDRKEGRQAGDVCPQRASYMVRKQNGKGQLLFNESEGCIWDSSALWDGHWNLPGR